MRLIRLETVVRDFQKSKGPILVKFQQKEGLIALISLLKGTALGFPLMLSSELVLNSFAALIKNGKITASDWKDIVPGLLAVGNKRVLHSKMFPKEAEVIINDFLKKYLSENEDKIPADMVVKTSEFVHTFVDLEKFKERFSTIRGKLFLLHKAKIENLLNSKDTANENSLGSLFVSLMDYFDLSDKQIIGLTSLVKSSLQKITKIYCES